MYKQNLGCTSVTVLIFLFTTVAVNTICNMFAVIPIYIAS